MDCATIHAEPSELQLHLHRSVLDLKVCFYTYNPLARVDTVENRQVHLPSCQTELCEQTPIKIVRDSSIPNVKNRFVGGPNLSRIAPNLASNESILASILLSSASMRPSKTPKPCSRNSILWVFVIFADLLCTTNQYLQLLARELFPARKKITAVSDQC